MKSLIFAFAVVAICSADRLDRTYLPPAGADTAGGSDGALSAPSGASGTVHHGPSSFESQGQSFGPQTHSRQQSFGPQSQSFRHQSQVSGPQPQSDYNRSPNTHSNFGQSNERYQPVNEGPQSDYEQNNQGAQYSQERNYRPGSNSDNRGVFNGSPNRNPNYDASSNNYQSQNGNPNVNYQARSQRPQASQEANAAILRSESNIDGDSFSYSYETENGISADESGVATNGVQAQGSFSYTGDDGQFYSITYTADENGYRPVGDHLPTPPPIPDAILKSIEENARAAAANQGGNYGEYDNSGDNQNYNGIGSSVGQQGRPSGNRYQGNPQSPSDGASNVYGPPTNRSPAHQQLNRQHTHAPQDFGGPRGNDDNNQYTSPSRAGSQSRYPGSQPQTYSSDRNQPGQESYDENDQQGSAPGYPSGRTNRPTNQDFARPSHIEQSGQRRPPASFNPDSGYKY